MVRLRHSFVLLWFAAASLKDNYTYQTEQTERKNSIKHGKFRALKSGLILQWVSFRDWFGYNCSKRDVGRAWKPTQRHTVPITHASPLSPASAQSASECCPEVPLETELPTFLVNKNGIYIKCFICQRLVASRKQMVTLCGCFWPGGHRSTGHQDLQPDVPCTWSNLGRGSSISVTAQPPCPAERQAQTLLVAPLIQLASIDRKPNIKTLQNGMEGV